MAEGEQENRVSPEFMRQLRPELYSDTNPPNSISA